MRTILRSCALISVLPTMLAACDGGTSRNTTSAAAPRGQLVENAASSSADEALTLAASLAASGANQQALAVLAGAHRHFPSDTRILSAYGRQAVVSGQDELATELLQRALAADPADWRALSAQAVLEGRQGRFGNAQLALGQAQSLSGGNAAVLNNLGMSYLLDGNAKEAAAMFRRALIAPDLKAAHAARIKRNLAVSLAVAGDFETAERLAGAPLPPSLRHARREAIARFMGIGALRQASRSGWTAQLADASSLGRDPLR